jgi:hypothetical protein
MLQHVQVSIFHYNTIGLHVVSIEIWPSADSMYFEHYLHVLAAVPIMWKTATYGSHTSPLVRRHELITLWPLTSNVYG